MRSEWTIMPLSEIVNFNPIYSIKKGTFIPYVEMAAVPENTREIAYFENREFSSGSKFKNGDTLFSRITPCLQNGKTARVSGLKESEIGNGSTEFIVMSAKDIDDKDFVYYLALDKEFRNYTEGRMEGTTGRQRVSWQALSEYEFLIPPKDVRQKIAHILSTLDDKIELNRKMNQTLEAMASAIFKSWFVDFDPVHEKANCEDEAELENIAKELGISKAILDLFPSEFQQSELGMIPKGWEVKTIDKILTVNPTYSIKKGTLSKYVELSKLSTSLLSIDNYEFREFVGGGAKFKNGDTILVRITPSLENGKRAFVDFLDDDEIGWGSTEYIILSAKKEIREWSYLLSISEDFRNYAISNMNGSSGRQRVPNNAVKEYKISTPSDEIFTYFSGVTNLLFKNIKSNTEQIRTLQKTRDTLLPKLLSGEIDVSELKI